MFGLEKKKKKPSKVTFALEKELEQPRKKHNLQTKIEERIYKLKTLLREGKDKETFQAFGTLLQGYQAVLKTISHIK